MSKKYFGTDGIRGKVNQTKINGEMFFKFGLGAGTYFKNQNKIKQSVYDWDSLQGKNYPPCCKRVSKLDTSLDAQQNRNYEGLQFLIRHPRYAKIIVQSKDVDIHALIGNIGGYVGLFLGT